MTEAEDRVACKGRTSERERTALKEEVWAKKSNLMKGRVTHLLMKRALHSSSKLPPFRRATSSTRAHTHTYTHKQLSALYLSLRARHKRVEWQTWRADGPPPQRGENALSRTDLKTTTFPLCLLDFFPPRSPHPLATSFLSSHPHISRPLLNFLVLHLFSFATPYSSRGFFLLFFFFAVWLLGFCLLFALVPPNAETQP